MCLFQEAMAQCAEYVRNDVPSPESSSCSRITLCSFVWEENMNECCVKIQGTQTTNATHMSTMTNYLHENRTESSEAMPLSRLPCLTRSRTRTHSLNPSYLSSIA